MNAKGNKEVQKYDQNHEASGKVSRSQEFFQNANKEGSWKMKDLKNKTNKKNKKPSNKYISQRLIQMRSKQINIDK